MPKCTSCGTWRMSLFLTDGECGRCTSDTRLSRPEAPLSAEAGRRSQLEAYSMHLDVLAGVEWSATMSLRTPRASLVRHKELFTGDPRHTPEYGSPAEGVWVPAVDWGGIGIEPPKAGSMASFIGQIPSDGGTLRPFLLEFREIVEDVGSVESKLRRIRDLCASSREFVLIASRIRELDRESYGEPELSFPESFFAHNLERVPGIGPALAARLFMAGFPTLKDLADAPDGSLLAVEGLGPKSLAQIRLFVT